MHRTSGQHHSRIVSSEAERTGREMDGDDSGISCVAGFPVMQNNPPPQSDAACKFRIACSHRQTKSDSFKENLSAPECIGLVSESTRLSCLCIHSLRMAHWKCILFRKVKLIEQRKQELNAYESFFVRLSDEQESWNISHQLYNNTLHLWLCGNAHSSTIVHHWKYGTLEVLIVDGENIRRCHQENYDLHHIMKIFFTT